MNTRSDVEPGSTYVRALRFDPLTRVYDPLMRWCLREQEFKQRLIQQARFEAGQRVLDVGCGTGTLALWIKQQHPGVDIEGLDGDARILDRARAKAVSLGLTLRWQEGMSYALPYPDGVFDRVVSSLVFHHLTHADRVRTFAEIWRVLRPGGELHFADWGPSRSLRLQLALWSVRLFDGVAITADNAQGRLPAMLGQAGFETVKTHTQLATVLGSLHLIRARRPAS